MAKFRVTLTDEERCVLRTMVSSGKGAARKLLHGRILRHWFRLMSYAHEHHCST